jgi:oxygen-independent coproporphyrinogen-3 oxidase
VTNVLRKAILSEAEGRIRPEAQVPAGNGAAVPAQGEGSAPRNDTDLPGLYVHIPFCLSKCRYCGFYSLPELAYLPAFLTALGEEIRLTRRDGATFDTIYIGGGTPSVLSAQQLRGILAALAAAFTVAPGAEITLEANPADLNAGLLAALREAGVNRINLGVQALDDRLLAFLGRRHDRARSLSALAAVRAAGFARIGIDLIYGIPGQSLATWKATLGEAIAQEPGHLSCYQLTAEPETPLEKQCRRGELSLPDEALQASFFHETSAMLEASGYIHYEVSNFARPGQESRHNRKYWNHTAYLGFGPSAHSFSGRERRWNHRSLETYLRELEAGRLPLESSEQLSDAELRLEALFLGLRTRRGIELGGFKRRYGQDLAAEKEKMLTHLEREGLVEIREGFLRPTRAGLAVADSLALI